jgi:hypothetical protein
MDTLLKKGIFSEGAKKNRSHSGAMARIFDKARWKKNSFGNCRHMLTAAAPRLSDKV